ncbi:hypothetical protein M440DRAFT_175500 [Trichoderma longibrachiatum ATCC 18648]|uniref:Uncharacterized protein n=1 Tax=Trichoderma longibrachiatum ATCC 18648 TaxID=983965 RepID=A0A2T4CEI2_TRILO|nr:hypothetical protein M440DRAFT_175500 [Trichoderma longibrachiatum ATCC 18648]
MSRGQGNFPFAGEHDAEHEFFFVADKKETLFYLLTDNLRAHVISRAAPSVVQERGQCDRGASVTVMQLSDAPTSYPRHIF